MDFGNGEECNSSSTESGWTMYLCSPKHSDESDVYNLKYVSESYKHEDEVESDDSMASDASSGPIRVTHSWDNGEISQTVYVNKVQAEKKNGGKYFSNKKAKYQKQEKEKSVHTVKEADVSVKGNGKVRKNSWFGKRK